MRMIGWSIRRRAAGVAVLIAFVAPSGCVVVCPAGAPLGQCTTLGHAVSGREEFTRACASCHGVDGRGDGPAAAALRTAPTDLTLLAERAGGTFPCERFVAVLTGDVPLPAHGSREMPVWSERFAPTDTGAAAAAAIYARRSLQSVTAYVESIQSAGRGGGPR